MRRQGIHMLKDVDMEVKQAIDLELNRQRNKLEMIASENFTSPEVMEAMGSVMKYSRP